MKIWDALAAYDKAKGRKYENPTGSMLVALDNDEPARNAASELVKVAHAELPGIHEVVQDRGRKSRIR